MCLKEKHSLHSHMQTSVNTVLITCYNINKYYVLSCFGGGLNIKLIESIRIIP